MATATKGSSQTETRTGLSHAEAISVGGSDAALVGEVAILGFVCLALVFSAYADAAKEIAEESTTTCARPSPPKLAETGLNVAAAEITAFGLEQASPFMAKMATLELGYETTEIISYASKKRGIRKCRRC